MGNDRILDMLCAMRPDVKRDSMANFLRGIPGTPYLHVSIDEFHRIEAHVRRSAIEAAEKACGDLTADTGSSNWGAGWIACRERCRKATLALLGNAA